MIKSSTIFWVFRDGVPVFRTSNRTSSLTRATNEAAAYPQSTVTVKKQTLIEEQIHYVPGRVPYPTKKFMLENV